MPTQPDPFATPALMEHRSQGMITTESHPYLADELAAATDDIRNFCRWHITPPRQVTYTRRGRNPGEIWLPAMELVSIDAVKLDGTVFDDDAVAAVEFDSATGWTSLHGRVAVVKYTAGYVEVPPTIQTITLELAAAALGTSLGYAREQAGSVSVGFARAGGGIDEGSVIAHRLMRYQIGRLP